MTPSLFSIDCQEKKNRREHERSRKGTEEVGEGKKEEGEGRKQSGEDEFVNLCVYHLL